MSTPTLKAHAKSEDEVLSTWPTRARQRLAGVAQPHAPGGAAVVVIRDCDQPSDVRRRCVAAELH